MGGMQDEANQNQKEEEMEEAKGIVKHILIAKFKDDITPQRIEQFIKDYANLVNLIPSMKAFEWGTDHDLSGDNLHQGFTHAFESTFESTEGVEEYVAHPAHVDFANVFLPSLEKVVVVDFKPTTVKF